MRVAIVHGVRTPFVKAGSNFKHLTMQQLGEQVVRAIVNRARVDANRIDECVFSSVLLDPRTPNWAREIIFAAGLPKSIYAQSVSNNCISGLVAITSISERIALGKIHCGIAGGSESMSNPTLVFRKRSTRAFLEMFRGRSVGDKLKGALNFRSPSDFLPEAPSITEPSTGLSMGEHMEITAKKFKIQRKDQDEIAYMSHMRSAAATEDGRLGAEIETTEGVKKDLIIRKDTSMERLQKLKPVFDASPLGTLTAGNSSPLTDGASAVMLMSEARARENNIEPLAFIKDYEYSAIDPSEGLLMAPAIAVPRLLKRLNLRLENFDLIEIHEAFGAQVLANIKAWREGWKEGSIGDVDYEKLNTLGGSIAIGHPFAATGGRIVTTLANEMKRRGARLGLISICAAGAMAGAMVLERD
jgi:acetyl-CoA acetyltransferase family protein